MARETVVISEELARQLASRGDELMRELGVRTGLKVFLRGDEVTLDGDDGQIARGRAVLGELSDLAVGGGDLTPQSIDAVVGVIDVEGRAADILQDAVWVHRGKRICPRTVGQWRYSRAIRDHSVTFGIGPAGTGKTYLAIAAAVAALSEREVSRIILTRPAVEAGERLGFLPGDLMAKVDPYLRPLFDALFEMLDAERVTAYLERSVIEVAPLAFMRGRTLNDAFIILDEAQNTTPEQMLMFLTRLGFGSKMVITGDVTQIDLQRGQASGLVEVQPVLADVAGISFTHLDSSDVVRHQLVQRIVDAYRRDAERRGERR